MPEYYNPLENAVGVTDERVDEGVDYGCGGGFLVAIADGVVTYSSSSPPGWPGEYLCYRITQPGALNGAVIYQAEGVYDLLPAGTPVHGGAGICHLSPGGAIEIGFGSDNPPNSWARQYSVGYDQVNSTGAGILFNELMGVLHGPQGQVQGHQLGAMPPYDVHSLGSITSGVLTPGQLLALYNPSTIIRHDFYQLGVHGRRAYTHANEIRALFARTSHVTSKGA